MSQAITVHVWKATHTSGTKFYHVVQFVSANGPSFALHHYGKVEHFTGLGKLTLGNMDLEEEFASRSLTNAGDKKIREKKKGGYSVSPVAQQLDFATVSDANAWMRTNFTKKAQDIAGPIINSAAWVVKSAPAAPKSPRPKVTEPEEPKHADWGSW